MKLITGLATVAAVGALIVVCRVNAPASFGFSTRSIKGSYAGIFQGLVLRNGAPLYVAGSGIFIADGKGTLSGHESFVINGIPCADVTLTGTYSVNSDGSGSDSISFSSPAPGCTGTLTQDFAIADSGRLVVLNNTGAGQEVTATWRQQGLPF